MIMHGVISDEIKLFCGEQMMKIIKNLVAVIATAGAVSMAVLAHAAETKDCDDSAHQHHRGPGPGGDGDFKPDFKDGKRTPFDEILSLTDVQKKTLETARATQETSMKDSREKMRAARDALDQARDANVDDATLAKLANNFASLIAQEEISRIKMHRQLVSILTPEQQKKLSAFEADHKGFGPGPGRWKDKQQSDAKTK
jgi:Spy/CpxP family protein refolding chaperone